MKIPNCDICHQEQTKLGAVAFSPPDTASRCDKVHICDGCWDGITRKSFAPYAALAAEREASSPASGDGGGEGEGVSNKTLAKQIVRELFQIGDEQFWPTRRIEFRLCQKSTHAADRKDERAGGGMCESALVDWLTKQLDARNFVARKSRGST